MPSPMPSELSPSPGAGEDSFFQVPRHILLPFPSMGVGKGRQTNRCRFIWKLMCLWAIFLIGYLSNCRSLPNLIYNMADMLMNFFCAVHESYGSCVHA